MPLSQIYNATRTLNNSEIINLSITAIDIAPAPGAGKMIVPMFAVVTSDTTAGAYTGVDAGAIGVRFTYASTSPFDLGEDPAKSYPLIANGQADKITEYLGQTKLTGGYGNPTSDYDDKPVKVSFNNNGAGILSGGHANNTLTVNFFYLIADLP